LGARVRQFDESNLSKMLGGRYHSLGGKEKTAQIAAGGGEHSQTFGGGGKEKNDRTRVKGRALIIGGGTADCWKAGANRGKVRIHIFNHAPGKEQRVSWDVEKVG